MHHHEDFPFPELARNAGGSTATGTLDAHIRVGDADREVVARRLSRAVTDGRLTLTEYDTRLQQLYRRGRSAGGTEIAVDLPRSRRTILRQNRGAERVPGQLVIMWMPWVAVNLLCLAIWLATGAGYFWPFWVAVPWGCALSIPTAIGVLAGHGTCRRHH
jgi:hypothetical protein